METNNNLVVIKHPLVEHYLSIIRDEKTTPEIFRNTIKKISNFLFIEASKNINLEECTVQTPIETCFCKRIDKKINIIAAPILRAGLVFADIFLEYLPEATVTHIGMCRNEKTLSPEWYLNKTKETYQNNKNTFVYILDPMLATGNSGKSVIDLFIKKGIAEEKITFISLISAPEGIKNIFNDFPNIRIITGALDRSLNNNGYIIPGLGDAGDRLYNTPV